MQGYHPNTAPDPAAWLALPDVRRLALVAACQREAGVSTALPDDHTRLHVHIEDAIAAGPVTPASRAAGRLAAQGLDRHDAIHALASVLLDADQTQRDARLDRLTAEAWRRRAA